MIRKRHQQGGFTIIEMIVSLGVFSVVITVAVGALLLLVASNRQLQEEQIVMTNLSFALDSMTREIRVGSAYFCETRPNYNAGGSSNIFSADNNLDVALDIDDVDDCSQGREPDNHDLHGLAFIEGGESITDGSDRRILYYIDYSQGVNEPRQIMRRIGNQAADPVTSSDIHIERLDFFVTGSTPQTSTNNDQPIVTIIIEASNASERANPNRSIKRLQTTITQRTLDL